VETQLPKVTQDRLRICVDFLLAALGAFVVWNAVRWSLEPGLYLYVDEVGNLSRFIDFSYLQNASLLPTWIYNDRPIGFALERLLYDFFGFNYTHQLSAFLVFHFANCAMGFVLFRRLGVSVPLSLAGIGLYGGLWTTAQTATYIGAVFDVVGLFFLLGSILAFLSDSRGSTLVSAFLFFLALRTKEFAIVTPVLLVVLGMRTLGGRALLSRVWPHFLIAAVIGLRYLSLWPRFMEVAGSKDPYHAELSARVILDSLSYYTALIVSVGDTSAWSVALACFGAATLAYGLWRRNYGLLFSLAAYVMFLLPVSILPGIRAPIYVYAPQMFLILAGVILVDDFSTNIFKQPAARWVTSVGVSAALLAWTVNLQMSPVFKDGTTFFLTARRISATTAQSAQEILP